MPQKEFDFSLSDFLAVSATELITPIELLSVDTIFREIPNWTSLNALLLISRLNELTGVFISSSDLADIRTLGELYALVVNKQNGTL